MSIQINTTAPGFDLPDTSGEHWGPFSGSGPTLIVFTCNHCPYALAWHQRLLDVARDYAPQGVRTLLINSNDAASHPTDSFDAMRERVAAEGPWPAPYLRDETQEIAREYGAQRTPEVFLTDAKGRLHYHGAPDADFRDESQNAAWVRSALDAVLAGGYPDPPTTEPVGCTIKWREG